MTYSTHSIEHNRPATLRSLLAKQGILRFIEAHNALAAMIAAFVSVERDGQTLGYDGFWSSSLTESLSRGMPDTEYLDFSLRMTGMDQVRAVTDKPLIYDADTGGLAEHFALHVPEMERHGVSATIIEDKTGPKRNSLFGTEVAQQQDDPRAFAEKIAMGKAAQRGEDFMVIARIESLILGKGVDDALERADIYLDAGADGIMIHHKERDPAMVWEFCERYRAAGHDAPLVAVPSAYSQVTEQELFDAGINVVIYANQMLRSAYPAMVSAATSILEHGRAKEADEQCLSIKEVIRLIEGGC